MPLVQTRGAASAQGFGEFAQSGSVNYIEDMFSTYLYTGNGSTQTITNGIDLSTKGGLVWTKIRSITDNHILEDTVRGAGKSLASNYPYPQGTNLFTLQSFLTNGYTVGKDSSTGASNETYVSWTWRNQPKFFQCLTYTGTGTGSSQNISHNLGTVPGCMIVKSTTFVDSPDNDWQVYHRSLPTPASNLLILNATNANSTGSSAWNSTNPTSTTFSVSGTANASGIVYVAYLFAHDAGGFGLTGTDNVISCGSWTTNTDVNLGYEPQWILFRNSGAIDNWKIVDNMRGFANTDGIFTAQASLNPNNTNAEGIASGVFPTATGFTTGLGSGTFIYIAIRRGPMKVPTLGTSVFSPTAVTNTLGTVNTTGFPVDMQIMNVRSGYGANGVLSTRLLGVSSNTTSSGSYLRTPSTVAEATGSDITRYWDNTGFQTSSNWVGTGMIYWSFGRAPSCMDVVCYTGTGVAGRTVTHNLTVAPELVIVKKRSGAEFWGTLYVATSSTGALNSTAALSTSNNQYYFGNDVTYTAPTASVFTVGSVDRVNASGGTYVAYLFATCAGVSKVGSYTGTGTTQTINCGFTGGARFVLIKRTDSTGGWYVWDSARGMVSGTDPSLLLNSTAAEVNANSVYAISTGFQIVSTAAEINANGGSFIFLAIA